MKIQNVNIKYFKIYKDFDINFDGKDCLIYGENGSGKSSIYSALHSVFYDKNLRKFTRIEAETYFKNRNHKSKDLEVKISLDNDETIARKGKDIYNLDNLNLFTAYFANEKILNRLTKENFYIALKHTLLFNFNNISSLVDIFSDFENIDRLQKKFKDDFQKDNSSMNEQEFIRYKINTMLEKSNEDFKNIFYRIIPINDINNTIKNELTENFTISFEIVDARLDDSDILKFIEPTIKIKIDNEDYSGKLYHHFNEAKLKLISIAIYFTLCKKYENANGLKILVLDDFLSSLDMANRRYIVQYILDGFKDYQKIILTHNIHFFNIILKLLKLNGVEDNWSIQKLFLLNDTPELYTYNQSYIDRAREELKKSNIDTASNLLRKEFERICTEFEEALQIGKKEEMKNIIGKLRNINDINRPLLNVLEPIENIIINSKADKLAAIQQYIERKKNVVNFNIEEIEINDFFKNILLNPMSHHDCESEHYKKDCEDAMEQLEKLNKRLKSIVKNKETK